MALNLALKTLMKSVVVQILVEWLRNRLGKTVKI